jgi:hypothetical protein
VAYVKKTYSVICSRTQVDSLIALHLQREELIRKHSEAKQQELQDRVIMLCLQPFLSAFVGDSSLLKCCSGYAGCDMKLL